MSPRVQSGIGVALLLLIFAHCHLAGIDLLTA